MLDDLRLEKMLACDSMPQLIDEAQHACAALGFELWAFSVRVLPGDGPDVPTWSLDNFPPDLREKRMECFMRSARLRPMSAPYDVPRWWLTAAEPPAHMPLHASLEAFREAAVAHNIHGGLCIPVHNGPDQHGFLTLATRNPLGERELSSVRPHALLFSRYLHIASLPHIERFRAEQSPQLSAREVECLSWAARGKTTWEIGRVLDISEHTVVYHLRNAVPKLGAVSRQQAIARATALGLLAPRSAHPSRRPHVSSEALALAGVFLG